jgi:colanic acid/amylovoran biosynthesis glycosyltransferase
MVARNYWSKCIESCFFILFELQKKAVPFEFTWVGGEAENDYMNNLIAKLNLTEKVRLIEKLDTHQLIQYYQHSDIILSTSVSEGLANVILESMATGCVPVVWNCEGMKEAIEDQVSGCIHPFGEISGMVDALWSLYHQPEERKKMSDASILRVNRFFDEKVHTQQMIMDYQKMVQSLQSFN